jgi:SpoIID/LytB domain protein
MSQFGARGRANAGQSLEQILTHYYDGTTFGVIDGQAPIRVQLAASYVPSPGRPARLTSLAGGWTSPLFPAETFAAGTFVEMWQPDLAPAPQATPEPTATPDPSPSSDPWEEQDPTDDPGLDPDQGNHLSSQGTAEPTAHPTAEPTATVEPTAQPTPTPSEAPAPSPTPSPVPAGHWVVLVYDAAGQELARTTAASLLFEPAASSTIIDISFKDSAPNMTQFRGSMRLTVTGSGGLQAVNIVPLDTYLRGVVPSEMPASWHMEAVKSQAVAARTYAWPRVGRSGSYDILPTAANQVYKGVLVEHPRSNQAVAETSGLVLLYNGKVITAYYHTASGGHTENSEFVWPTTAGNPGSVVSYVRGKPDVDANGVPYDISFGRFAYQSAPFTMAQLSSIMSRNASTDVGEIHSLSFRRGVSERVYQVTLVGSNGTKVVKGGVFKNTYNNNRLSGGDVNSTMYWLLPVEP